MENEEVFGEKFNDEKNFSAIPVHEVYVEFLPLNIKVGSGDLLEV